MTSAVISDKYDRLREFCSVNQASNVVMSLSLTKFEYSNIV